MGEHDQSESSGIAFERACRGPRIGCDGAFAGGQLVALQKARPGDHERRPGEHVRGWAALQRPGGNDDVFDHALHALSTSRNRSRGGASPWLPRFR